MSTEPTQPEPADPRITDRAPDPAPPPEAEPFLAESVDDDEPVVLRRRRRLTRPPRPPGPPHPGFWWAVGWCFLMLIVAQLTPAFGVSVVVIGRELLLQRGPGGAEPTSPQQLQHLILLPTVFLSQTILIAFSIVVLRLVVGRDFPRQVALRLPAATHVLLVVLLWPALAFGASGVYQATKQLPGMSHILSYLVAVPAALAVAGLFWCLIRLITGTDWLKSLARQHWLLQLVAAPIVCLAVAEVGAGVFRLVDPHLPTFDMLSGGMMEDAVKEFRSWPSLLAILIVGLGPGLGEELWCRAFLGRGLVGRHGPVMGVIMTSFFFGAIHGDPHQGMMAAVMGLVLHFTYLMSRSLWVPMLLHFLNNSLSVIADKLPDWGRERAENIDTNPQGIPWQVLAAAVFLLAAVGWALYSSRGRLVRTDGSDLPPWQPPFPSVAHPPPDSGTAVVYPWPGLLPTCAVITAVVAFGSAVYWG
jgi:membrane protease YdiL (CAAX protease family)